MLGTQPKPLPRHGAWRTLLPPVRFKGEQSPEDIQPQGGPQAEDTEAKQGGGALCAVTFAVKHHVNYGQRLKVVGSPDALGAWECSAAPEMAWSEGDQWALTVDLPAGKHEFKIAVGSKRGEQVEWEHGHNRVVEVPDPKGAASSHGPVQVDCEWSHTEEGAAASREGQTGKEGLQEELAPSGSGHLPKEAFSGEPIGAANDEDLSRNESPDKAENVIVGKMESEGGGKEGGDGSKTLGKMEVQGGPKEDPHAPEPVVASDRPSQSPGTRSSIEESKGAPAGGLSPAKEKSVRQDMQQLERERVAGQEGGSGEGGKDERKSGYS